jgi:hypothetical protein
MRLSGYLIADKPRSGQRMPITCIATRKNARRIWRVGLDPERPYINGRAG